MTVLSGTFCDGQHQYTILVPTPVCYTGTNTSMLYVCYTATNTSMLFCTSKMLKGCLFIIKTEGGLLTVNLLNEALCLLAPFC